MMDENLEDDLTQMHVKRQGEIKLREGEIKHLFYEEEIGIEVLQIPREQHRSTRLLQLTGK